MIVRIDIPVLTGDPGFTLVAGDTVKIIACQGVCFARVREVIDVTRPCEDVAVFGVIAEVEAAGDDSDAKQR